MDIGNHFSGVSDPYITEDMFKAKNGYYIMIPDSGKMGHYSRIVILLINSLLITTLLPGFSLINSSPDVFMFDHKTDRTDATAIPEKVVSMPEMCISNNYSVNYEAIPDHQVSSSVKHEKIYGIFPLPQREFMHSVTEDRDQNPFLNLSPGIVYAESDQVFNRIKYIDPVITSESGFLLQTGYDAEKIKGSVNYPRSAPPNTRLLIPGIASLALITFLVDEPVVNFARAHQTSFLKSVAHYTDAGGEKKIVVPGVLLTYVTARFLLKDERLKNTTLNSIQSVIVTAIATEGVKYLAGRARPFTLEGAYSFQPFPGGVDRYKSLPSGHTSLAFALFTPYAETYSRWIYLVPVSVAFGRVYQDKHWLSDVVTGGGIGLISGILFTHHENIQIIPNGLRIYF